MENFQLIASMRKLSVLHGVVSVMFTMKDYSSASRFLKQARASSTLYSCQVISQKHPSLFVFWNCRVRSINIQQDMHFVLHFSPVDLDRVQQLIQIMKDRVVKIVFTRGAQFTGKSPGNREIEELLQSAPFFFLFKEIF